MKAAVFEGAGRKLALRTIDDPTPGAGEVVMKVGRCGICGTDLHMTSGHAMDFPAGTVLGHEFSGEVVALGKGVETLKIGDIITAMPCTGCGECAACLAGAPLMCAKMEGRAGGFAEYLRSPERFSVKLPAAVSLADGALVEPLAVGLHGVAMAQMAPGAKVLVLGAGSVGLAAIFWARRLGAGRIVAASPSARRADMAASMGADGFVALREADAAVQINEKLGGPPDVVFECAGAVGLLGKGIELMRSNGLLVSMGFCTSPDAIVPAMATMKQVRLAFSMGYTLAEFQYIVDTLEAGHVEPRQMITEVISLQSLPDEFEAMRAGKAQTKVHLEPWAQ